MSNLGNLAEIVDEAARNATAVPQLTIDAPDLTPDDGYAIQAMAMARRLSRGERRVGMKMGLTSRAKMIQVNVEEVIWGRLTDGMRVEEGGFASMADYVHPRVEPEIAFLMGAPLSGNVSAVEAMNAVEAVAPAMEIIDSRYKDFKFTWADVVADNCSSSGFVIGNWCAPDTDIANAGMVMEIDGQARQIGSSAAILGHPVRSLVAAARMVAQWGESLEPGYIVMAGGATAAEPLAAGMSVRNNVQGLGAVSFQVEA
ncbi:MAG: 4-oxalocrotonate decarboxylase [Alphaproteobacteria bacterium]|jgi:2-oxo-3-hexenedioate decarboxylase|nr:4-oxalocrotonate decarboxylase [Alphaproteobacteria bacterium]MBT4086166.1 4-oxalocrotonate decarboxylase [Alphaproteobacteria bacterium]MBT4543783.1 4-oxalocrotonate decarboxylase [Alphaproteobacteria bacterium]MBT7744028.1 4-oxalocrotonate decarboxylase [Alphaproteobacteria bacterium]